MKISIITTNFNTDKYLEQTIKSILGQKGDFELEYIITDGGSKDNSLSIIKKYEKEIKDGKWGNHITFRWISEKDKGQSDGINKGLKMATGDIVAFLNADDLYTDGALDRVVTYFKENPDCMWLTGYCPVINEDGEEIRKLITKYKELKLSVFSLNQLLIDNNISQPATFWRSELMEEVGFIDESYHYSMDQEFWIRIAKKYKLCLIKENLAKFRFVSGTKTASAGEKTLEESRRITKKYTNNKIVLFRQWIGIQMRLILKKLLSLIN